MQISAACRFSRLARTLCYLCKRKSRAPPHRRQWHTTHSGREKAGVAMKTAKPESRITYTHEKKNSKQNSCWVHRAQLEVPAALCCSTHPLRDLLAVMTNMVESSKYGIRYCKINNPWSWLHNHKPLNTGRCDYPMSCSQYSKRYRPRSLGSISKLVLNSRENEWFQDRLILLHWHEVFWSFVFQFMCQN